MEAVAEHINDMKKKYDVAVHVQEVQSVLRGWEVRKAIHSLCDDDGLCFSLPPGRGSHKTWRACT